MSSQIDRLQQLLSATLVKLNVENFAFSNRGIEAMQKTVERIRKTVGDRPATPSKDSICSALKKLRERGASALNGMEFYFVCWGLTESCGRLPMLIEDDLNFEDLMSAVRLRKPPTLLWRGLLDAYFRYVPSSDCPRGEYNWRLLSAWLSSDLQGLYDRTSSTLRPALAWLTVLREHQRLLSGNPCRPYAEKDLRGDRTEVDRITGALNITETSWFWQQLILSQVDEAIGWRDDTRFKNTLETLIAQLSCHPSVSNEGLAKLLTRYAHCTDKSVHEGLKVFAVETWGSPQLVQQARWGLVEPDVKGMICQWLVMEDLEDFFQILAADGTADKRRLRFWSLFIKQICFSHIVLGRDLWSSHDQDWVTFRQKKKGRFSRLDGGAGSRNAFIMKIGGHYFIEFGDTGDACYGYVEGCEPFMLGTGALSDKQLKNKQSCIFWGSHRGDWERRFFLGGDEQNGLYDLGIYPD